MWNRRSIFVTKTLVKVCCLCAQKLSAKQTMFKYKVKVDHCHQSTNKGTAGCARSFQTLITYALIVVN